MDQKALSIFDIESSYPKPDDPDLQYKLYKKRELYMHKMQQRPEINSYADLKKFRDETCGGTFRLHDHQTYLSNYINPDTPYRGILIFHGLGTGKCITGEAMVNINGTELSIEEYWNLNMNKDTIHFDGTGYWATPLAHDITYTFDRQKFSKSEVIHGYKQLINEFIKTVTLNNGSIINITLSHKLLTNRGWTNNFTESDYIGTKVNDNIYYSKVVSIEYKEYKGYVYDMEINKTHNFVANGIIVHNTCLGITIAEKFKNLVQKYNTKIYVLVSGPLLKENWKEQIIKCTKDTYLKNINIRGHIQEGEHKRNMRNAINQAMQYYKFMSYRSFSKKVLGDKIIDKKEVEGNKIKITYRRSEDGNYERDVSTDKIDSLSNTIIIVDEAHSVTGNDFGEALKYIVSNKNSINLKLVMLTGTPMKNLADDIVDLINYMRPQSFQMERDKIFENKQHLMTLKDGGIEYFKKMTSGYISHVRGGDPNLYAVQVDVGEIPDGLLFTSVVRCKMNDFQLKIYTEAKNEEDDSLDKKSSAVSNFVFPVLSSDKKKLTGEYGKKGLNVLKNQLKLYKKELNSLISSTLFNNIEDTYIDLTEDGKNIKGKIFQEGNLQLFSAKFNTALSNLNCLFEGKKGSKTAFVYSNLVKVGINLFNIILIENGYLEYQEDSSNYLINSNTICYYCGQKHGGHSISTHDFFPATFLVITGKTGEEEENMSEDKINIINNVFNKTDNREGKKIKIVLGSAVMNEGISLKNVGEVHILDVYFNFRRVDQAIGRAIRYCSHYQQMTEKNQWPQVNVYKYVVKVEEGLSTEEELYRKAELKYILIKKIERAMKENAIDCPHNLHGNIYKEEVEKYKNCSETNKENLCPHFCDYTKCTYKCNNNRLNNEYYDPERNIYKNISKENLDYSTYNYNLARVEIEHAKNKIKDMYLINYLYTLPEILNHVKFTFSKHKLDLFDEFYVYKALDELLPINENDFNNFKDPIIDKYNRQGYLIYRGVYYIFQSFDEPNENIAMYYRKAYFPKIKKCISLFNYLRNLSNYDEISEVMEVDNTDIQYDTTKYNFDDVMEYYESPNRQEFKYVGIIDSEITKNKSKYDLAQSKDTFKIREQRSKILKKKRETGIPSLKGAVCYTSKSKQYLKHISKILNIDTSKLPTREDICEHIKNKMLMLEKYQTGTKKTTYIIIPSNHPQYKFPYNLEDRIEFVKNQLSKKIPIKIDITIKKIKKISGPEKDNPSYILNITDTKEETIENFSEILQYYGFKKNNGKWYLVIE